MTALLSYVPVFALNLVIMVWIIRRRGFTSFEGLGIFCFLIVVVSDWLGLIINYSMGVPGTGAIWGERIYPSLVTIIGLLSLMLGLTLADPRPIKLPRKFSPGNLRGITEIGWFLVIIGLAMKLITLSTEGISSLIDYFHYMSAYVVIQRKLGGFLDEGVTIMIFGFALIAASHNKFLKQIIFLIIMILLNFFLSTSRGGIIGPVIFLFLLLWIFNREMIKDWSKFSVIAPLSLILILSAGYKSMIRTGSDKYINTEFSVMFQWGIDRYMDRFSDVGLYDGYSNFINRLSDNKNFYHGKVIDYTLTSWIPYVIYKNKPTHPFRAIGDLVYRDYRTSFSDVSAVTLIGTAFADYGWFSLVSYLIAYGMLLGFIRKWTVRIGGSLLLFIWYLHFMLIEGFSNFIHGGIVNIMDSIALSTGVMGLCFLYLQLKVRSYTKTKFMPQLPTSAGCTR